MKWWGLVLAMFQTAVYAVSDIVLLTDSQYPPYSYVEDSQAKGLYVELVQSVVASMEDYEVEIRPMPWQQAKHMLRKGRADGLIGVYFHGDKWPYMQPYSSRLAKEHVWTACGAEAQKSELKSWPEDYQGKLITHVAGYDGWLSEGIRSKRNTALVNFIEVPNMETGVQMVKRSIADCALVENIAFEFVENQSDAAGLLKLTTLIDTHDVFIGYTKVRSDVPSNAVLNTFIKAFDAQLNRAIANGQLDAIYVKYGHPLYH